MDEHGEHGGRLGDATKVVGERCFGSARDAGALCGVSGAGRVRGSFRHS